MFKIGDLAVYPAHGVGVIESIESKEISGITQTFYTLRIKESGMTILIPVNNAKSVGLRKVVDEDTVSQVYKILKDKDTGSAVDNKTWNRRYRRYMERIKTGCVLEIASVFRDLYLLKYCKELSFGERKMLETAKNLLVKELSIAKNIAESKIEEELNCLLNHNGEGLDEERR